MTRIIKCPIHKDSPRQTAPKSPAQQMQTPAATMEATKTTKPCGQIGRKSGRDERIRPSARRPVTGLLRLATVFAFRRHPGGSALRAGENLSNPPSQRIFTSTPLRGALVKMVGMRGFEPPTPSSRTKCATRLRYIPTLLGKSLYQSRACRARYSPVKFCPWRADETDRRMNPC